MTKSETLVQSHELQIHTCTYLKLADKIDS